ncbi:MAG: hypothetical protein E7036_09440 [Opitutales bacterium]|nr:hypothetical protein [Opitutales bacterium]
MKNLFIFVFIALLSVFSYADDIALLPTSDKDKPAISYDYFPSRLHAFVFRNWTSIPVETLAKTISATPAQINEIASEMGLPPQRKIQAEWISPNGYITVLRRNWHILNYRQLLILLDVDAKTLRSRLDYDDFLFGKLGNFKPICDELHYKKSTQAVKEKAKHIANLLKKNQIEKINQECEKFAFFKKFSKTKGLQIKKNNNENINIASSYFSDFSDPLLTDVSYPEGLLEELASRGVNGVWLHVVLNMLVEPDGIFPGSKDAKRRIANLNKLIERADKFGIKVWLYFNEPRGMEGKFYEQSPAHKAIRGAKHQSKDIYCMCTSNKDVMQWLSKSVEKVSSQTPKLGGVFTITAFENPTNCHSGRNHKTCPRCKDKKGYDVISEVNNTIFRALRKSNPSAKLIAWDWGWINKEVEKTIERLDKDIIYMALSERDIPLNFGGVKAKINEYALSVVGPSQRALEKWKYAQANKIAQMAKIQINLTWEFASTPALPLLKTVAQHSRNLKNAGINNYFLSWSLGGYPSENMELFNSYDITKSVKENMMRIAEKYYGKKSAEKICTAWEIFSDSFKEYPFDVYTIYKGPHNVGVANPIYARKTNFSATMVCYPFDDLKSWRSIYPENIYIDQMRKVATGFSKALEVLESVDTNDMTNSEKSHFIQMKNWATTAYIHFASTVNQAEFVKLRDEQKQANIGKIQTILDSEETLTKRQLEIALVDTYVGFECANHYYYTAIDFFEKLISIDFARKNF